MKSFRASSLSFTLPESWADITYVQQRALYATRTALGAMAALSGLSTEELRSLNAATLNSIVETQLRFLSDRPDFSTLAVPSTLLIPGLEKKPLKQRILSGLGIGSSLTIDGKSITIPRNIGAETTYGQKADIDEQIKNMSIPEDDEAALHQLAPLLLGVYLAPLITGAAYTDIEQAWAVLPRIEALPCTVVLPIAAFFFVSYLSITRSGTPSLAP